MPDEPQGVAGRVIAECHEQWDNREAEELFDMYFGLATGAEKMHERLSAEARRVLAEARSGLDPDKPNEDFMAVHTDSGIRAQEMIQAMRYLSRRFGLSLIEPATDDSAEEA